MLIKFEFKILECKSICLFKTGLKSLIEFDVIKIIGFLLKTAKFTAVELWQITPRDAFIISHVLLKKTFTDNENHIITKEEASKELSLLPQKLANKEITSEEYRKIRDELERILFD